MPLTLKYRPQTFSDVVSQEDAVAMLQATIAHPETAVRTLILCGSHGCGKTTLARIFSRSLNCSFRTGVDACGVCDDCKSDIGETAFYQEYDATQVGNKEWITAYKDNLQYTAPPAGKWLVVTFDEAHEISAAGQKSLLKLLEEAPSRVFFALCTTNPEKFIDMIRSRALELTVNTIPTAMISKRLRKIADTEKIEIADDLLTRIANYSSGHMRDALMRLDQYCLLPDKEAFAKLVTRNDALILNFLNASMRKDKEAAQLAVSEMVKRPLSQLELEWESVTLELVKYVVGVEKAPGLKADTAKLFGQNIFRLVRALAAEWSERCWRNDLAFQAFAWYLYYEFSKSAEVSPAVSNPDDRFRKQ